eukprot:GEMP01024584.1.p1 GENE.GEMP01024584.1~~GEMP01024584.1.p1  ORF type:complete len:795 (+),score=156.90 GEMP01024584.1:34-2385(+)
MWRPPRELRNLRGDPEVKRLIGLLRKGHHEAARTLAAYPIGSCADLASACSVISKAPTWGADRRDLLEGFANKAIGARSSSLCIIGNALARHRISVDMIHELLGRLPLRELNGTDIQMLAVYCGRFSRDFDSPRFWERMVTVPLTIMSPVGLATLVQSIARTQQALPRWRANVDFRTRLKDQCMQHLGGMEPRHLCSLMSDLLYLDALDSVCVGMIEREARRQLRSFQTRDQVQFAKCLVKVPKSMRVASHEQFQLAPRIFPWCQPVDFTEILRLWTTQGWNNIALSGELLNRWRDGFCKALPQLSSERLAFVTKDMAKRPNAPRIVSVLLEPTLKRVDVSQLSVDGVVAACRGLTLASGDVRLRMPYLLEQRFLDTLGAEASPHLVSNSIDAFAALSHTPEGLISHIVRTAACMGDLFVPRQIAQLAKSFEQIQLQLPHSVVRKAAATLHKEPESWSPQDLVSLVSSTDDKLVIQKAEKYVLKMSSIPQQTLVSLAAAFGPLKVWKRIHHNALEFHDLRQLAELHLDDAKLDRLSTYMAKKAAAATFEDAAAITHLWSQRERQDVELFDALEPVLSTGICNMAFYGLAKLGVAPMAQRHMARQLQNTDFHSLSDADVVRIVVALGTMSTEHKETLESALAVLVSRNPTGWTKSIGFAGAMAKHLFGIDDEFIPPRALGERTPQEFVLDGIEKSLAACFGPVEQFLHPPFSLRLCIPDTSTIFEVLMPEDFFGETDIKPFSFQRLRCLEAMGYKVALVPWYDWPNDRIAQRSVLLRVRRQAEE